MNKNNSSSTQKSSIERGRRSPKNELRLMYGDTPNHKLSVEPTSDIRNELVEAAFKDGLIIEVERDRFLKSDLYATVIDVIHSCVYKNLTYKELEEKFPNVLKWYRKYDSQYISALQSQSNERKELQLSAAALLKAMHQDRLIKFSSDTLKQTVERNPEIAMQLLLQNLPEDFETMSKEAPRTLLYLKHNDKLRYDIILQRHLGSLRKKN